MNRFDDSNLRLAIATSENAKKSVEALAHQFEQQRPYIKKLFKKIDSLNRSNAILLNKLTNKGFKK